MTETNFENKMKQLSEIEEVTPDIQIHATHQLRYPTKEELENLKNSDGGYSLGAAQTTYAPMPTDEEMYGQHYNRGPEPSDNDMLAGLDVDGETKKDTFINNVGEKDTFPTTAATVKKPEIAKKEVKISDANCILIENAKKEEVELELSFRAKIPVNAFFAAMDDSYVKKNQNQLLGEIISRIKMNELDKQLKEKLKEFYGLK